MSTTITKRAIPHPKDPANRQSVEALQQAVNELSGAVGQNMQRAVRVCELVEAGLLQLQPNGQLGRSTSVDEIGTISMSDVTGLTAALNARVLKAGDTMTGTLANTASIGFDLQRTNGRMLLRDNGSGFPTIDFVNPANSAFVSGRSTSDGFSFNTVGAPFDFNNGNLRVNNGDIFTYRAGGTTGVIFLRADATRYLYYDGGKYVMPGAGLDVGGTIQSDTRAITGLLGGEGFQMVWNTVQAGQGRTEYVNNRGGGSGGFTWWDRANTGVGTGTVLALLNSNGLFVNGTIQFATSGVTVGQLSAWPPNMNYAALLNAGMSGNEYALLTAAPGVDLNTYISSITGGTVKIRPSANSTTGEATFSTTGVTFAQPCTGPNFTAISDERLKVGLVPVPFYHDIDRLRLIEWSWKKDGKRGRGVSAQAVQQVAPGYVFPHPETGMLSVDKAGLALELALLALSQIAGARHAVSV